MTGWLIVLFLVSCFFGFGLGCMASDRQIKKAIESGILRFQVKIYKLTEITKDDLCKALKASEKDGGEN